MRRRLKNGCFLPVVPFFGRIAASCPIVDYFIDSLTFLFLSLSSPSPSPASLFVPPDQDVCTLEPFSPACTCCALSSPFLVFFCLNGISSPENTFFI